MLVVVLVTRRVVGVAGEQVAVVVVVAVGVLVVGRDVAGRVVERGLVAGPARAGVGQQWRRPRRRRRRRAQAQVVLRRRRRSARRRQVTLMSTVRHKGNITFNKTSLKNK